MIAETLLVVWLIACAYVPLLLAITRTPPTEVRRVTNALVMQRATTLIAQSFKIVRDHGIRVDPRRWRATHDLSLTATAPVYAVDAEEVAA